MSKERQGEPDFGFVIEATFFVDAASLAEADDLFTSAVLDRIETDRVGFSGSTSMPAWLLPPGARR